MIQIDRVSKSYGAVRALASVSLDIHAGERVAFVGSNGSGKTTLLRCLLGLLRFEGTVTIGGSDVSLRPEVALQQVAYVPQIAPPLDAPVREVVEAYTRLRGRAASGVVARAHALGLDLEASAGKRFRDLSGGMKQKLLAALALAAETPILVCDEPTANLDGEARAEFMRQLDARPEGGAVLLCSHRVDEVRLLVDRVVELSEGTVHRDAAVADFPFGPGSDRPSRLKVVS
jgi:ABC-type multidrug transport system ATPase subunit